MRRLRLLCLHLCLLLVHSTRQQLGRELAREAPVEADVVVAVPDSGTPHAVGFAQEMGIPYTEGFTKNRYVGRTFIEPTQELRESKVRMKFNPLGDNLVGKRVVMVDDSIVRGHTSKQIVKLAREMGAAKVYMASYSPPLEYPCPYGIDMSTRREFIARDRTVDESGPHDSTGHGAHDGKLGHSLDGSYTADQRNPRLARRTNSAL